MRTACAPPIGPRAGPGTVLADVFSDGGTVSPGASPGVLGIGGSFEQTLAAELRIDIEGLTAGTEYDVLEAAGPVTLDGRLSLVFGNYFAPKAGDTFDVVRGQSITGSFDSVEILGLFPGWGFEVSQDNGILRITSLNDARAIPEPATLGLLTLGGLGLLRRRRRVTRGT